MIFSCLSLAHLSQFISNEQMDGGVAFIYNMLCTNKKTSSHQHLKLNHERRVWSVSPASPMHIVCWVLECFECFEYLECLECVEWSVWSVWSVSPASLLHIVCEVFWVFLQCHSCTCGYLVLWFIRWRGRLPHFRWGSINMLWQIKTITECHLKILTFYDMLIFYRHYKCHQSK